MRCRFRCHWNRDGVSCLFWGALAVYLLALLYLVSHTYSNPRTTPLRRYRASVPVLQTRHLEVRACRTSHRKTEAYVKVYVRNVSVLRLSDLHLTVRLDGLPPLNPPAPIRDLRSAVVAKSPVSVGVRELELHFPPPATEHLQVSVRYTVDTIPPEEHTGTGKALLMPCE